MFQKKPAQTFAALLCSLAIGSASLLACSKGEQAKSSGTDDKKVAVAPMRSVSIPFVAKVNGAAFDCNSTYHGVGSTQATWQPKDLRFYVSQVRLVRQGGEVVDVTMLDDDMFQRHNVALLDFENKSGLCQNGTTQTHTVILGEAPEASDYVGLRFVVSVPFAANHADASTAQSPLDQAGMFWSWQSGYKFFSLEGYVNGHSGHNVHIGSTGCEMSSPNVVSRCSAPNEIQVNFDKFGWDSQSVVLDIGKLLATSDVAAGMGCMAEANNAACAPFFAAFGLSGGASAQQSVFTAE